MNDKRTKKREQIIQAETLSSRFLAHANEASERGSKTEADKLYDKAQYWLDRYNKLAGNAD